MVRCNLLAKRMVISAPGIEDCLLMNPFSRAKCTAEHKRTTRIFRPPVRSPGFHRRYWGILTGLSEDCLNMDIYVPNKAPPAGGFPTMVFFYGGSFEFGGASFPLYDGETDVALMKDVILVAVNYRRAYEKEKKKKEGERWK